VKPVYFIRYPVYIYAASQGNNFDDTTPYIKYNMDDHLGSSCLRLSDTGALIDREEHYPFGETSFGSYAKKRYRFCGKEKDEESGLYYYGVRYYSPWTCRFISVDPLAHERVSLSPYNYCSNDPINRVDPTGASDDWVQDADGNVKWDKDANSQATTKAGETYLGKTLTFKFNSYIDKNLWDVPSYKSLFMDPSGDKLTSTINITGNENRNGELTSISASMPNKPLPGPTPIGTARDYYPGLGSDQNKFTSSASGFNINFEQHSSVSPFEEFALNATGYSIVNVAQKLNLNYSQGKLSITTATDVFPSATLTMNGRLMMQYNQPSFQGTHSLQIKGWTNPSPYKDNLGPQPIYDYSYKPAMWYKR